ncbi:MAG: hypothetical protein FGM62_06135 [Methylobacterium sp.]|nr:hypothetical protein [Methylobacterium sp.]
MAEQQADIRQPEASGLPPPGRPAGVQVLLNRLGLAVFSALCKLGLFVFMLFLPGILLSYPAYLTGARLWDYEAARVVEAKLERIEINTVEHDQDRSTWLESRKHIDITFYFTSARGEKLASVSEHGWPAPGLKRRLQEQYQPGDEFSLYILPDQSIVKDIDLAVSQFYRMTILMGLLFLAMLMAAMIWKRLLHQMPQSLPEFPQAGLNSFLAAQAIVLLVAALFAWINSFSTMLVPITWFLAAYWGMTALLTLTLRLLVFSPPPVSAPAATEREDDDPRAAQLPASRG